MYLFIYMSTIKGSINAPKIVVIITYLIMRPIELLLFELLRLVTKVIE